MTKKLISLLLLGTFFLGVLTACKYEEGPAISFRTKTERVVNTWEVKEANENGVNTTEDYMENQTQLAFDYDNTFKIYTVDDSGDVWVQEGLWDLIEDKTQIRLIYTDPPINPDRSTWDILQLREKAMTIQEDMDGDVTWLDLVPADSLLAE